MPKKFNIIYICIKSFIIISSTGYHPKTLLSQLLIRWPAE